MSVRRSSRANKGQNKFVEEERQLEEALRKAEEEAEAERLQEEEGHVLCTVCGTTDANYDEEEEGQGDMIQCDQCRTWQHSNCMLRDPSNVPELYRCNVCDPLNAEYALLECKLDPTEVKRILEEDDKKKASKQKGFLEALKELDPEQEFAKKDSSGDDMSDDGDDDDDDDGDDDDDKDDVGPKEQQGRPLKRKSPAPEKKVKVRKLSHDDIEEKARQAVTKRFEGMFLALLPGHKIPNETGSEAEVSHRWAVKLEEDLFDAYHEKSTGKISKDYKEASTRIFVNVRDVKNTRLRNSIINRHIPFNRLVKMPVGELLNPALRSEREEAIKESMTQATLEQVKVSNIRRTHKGDIVLDNEESSGQQFDFNVGVHLDENEKKFAESENTVERARSVDPVMPSGEREMYDPSYEDEEPEHSVRILDDDDDEDLSTILGQTSKKLAEVDGYDPTSIQQGAQLWHGQTIFTGVTNFESHVSFQSTTLNKDEFRDVAYSVFDANLPLEVEGRLDSNKAEEYLLKVSTARKMILLELKNSEQDTGFKRLWDYFHSKKKYGVVRSKQPFVKDVYLFPVSNRLPKFLRQFGGFKLDNSAERLFLVLVVKQEMIKEFAKSTQQPLQEYDARASLGANEMALMQKIFEEKPETKNNPALLVQHLQELLKRQG